MKLEINLEDVKSFLAGLLGNTTSACNDNSNMIDDYYKGKEVIVRTFSAGVWFGKIEIKKNDEIILIDAVRMWEWFTKESISLSSCAVNGVVAEKCKFAPKVAKVWLQPIELIECSEDALKSIKEVEAYAQTK